ncbi:MAG: hypothetical protein JOS17DRAFT_842620 [Linnemannia elongata]|nr:MAG: hypothetical protein JOS17DRAFT_842620 [Linnemannia elongata]
MEINPAVTFKHDCTVMIAKHPKVLIVGAGLGGLTLGMILQKTDIPYEIIERASEVKHLGAGIAINCTVTPAFKQCGIYNELVSISKVLDTINISNEERGIEFVIADNEDPIKRYGSGSRLITRPKLYDFLLRQVPSERIHMSKKALSTLQGGNDVLVRCADGSEYEGDILVRADGAYSAVRQNLYSNSTSQSTPCVRRFTTTLHECLSRRADTPPDSGRVPGSGEDQFKDNDAFRNSEWSPEAAQVMCEEVRHFPIIGEGSHGGKELTLGDLFDLALKEYLSKVMLEEKVFKTWYDCRTVLIGDANYIHALPDHPITDEIEGTFKAYQDECIEWVQSAFETSQTFRNMVDKGAKARITRFVMKNLSGWIEIRRADAQQQTPDLFLASG